MKRREFLRIAPGVCASPALLPAQAQAAPEPIAEPHFPSRLYQFVWRNWELANTARMAQVIGTTPPAILQVGASMGLPRKRSLTSDQLARLYITVIRQNWHLLPEEQIIELLGWDRARFEFTLKEDDFLDVKLGNGKPRCAALRYDAPTRADKVRAAQIHATVQELFGDAINHRGEDLFQFVTTLSTPARDNLRNPSAKAAAGEIDLTRGWDLHADEDLKGAGERFREYLGTAMGADLVRGAAARMISLTVDPAQVHGPEAFRIVASNDAITITGSEPRGVLQAIYRLQDYMERREAPLAPAGVIEQKAVWDPRYLYSYFALYGDPLLDVQRDPFPEAYLERLARCGINGVWIQAVLNTLAPSKEFPEFGQGSAARLKNLGALVERARRFGVRVYLYLNEPRAMPASFFQAHPDVRGSSFRNLYAMCTSTPQVRNWIANSLAHVVDQVPQLGGIFCITMSENHTNCFSHGGAWGTGAPNAGDCPRCTKRNSWDVIGELIGTFRDGVRSHSSDADIVAWDWGWGDALAERLIPLLPRDVRFLSISEWDSPVHRGGIQTKVGEYSISVVGPGPRASQNWRRARATGVQPMAKVQFNNTWEISAVPYIPVMNLILQHCDNLARAGMSGIMGSWTCGGYASPNLVAAKSYYFEPRPPSSEILKDAAIQRYGAAAASDAVEAWRQFSEAFQEFPYGVSVYIIPTQHGPANPLRLQPTGYRAGMLLFPYDDYRHWAGKYPPEAMQKQFATLASRWKSGLDAMERAAARTPARKRKNADLDLAIATTCYHHFQSTANQVEFYLLRDGESSPAARARMRAIAEHEIELARRQFRVARDHSVIAYEASNHYYYTPLDLVEKTLQCRRLIRQLEGKSQTGGE